MIDNFKVFDHRKLIGSKVLRISKVRHSHQVRVGLIRKHSIIEHIGNYPHNKITKDLLMFIAVRPSLLGTWANNFAYI